MLLAIDIGNTNISTGLFQNGLLVATRRAATNRAATPDQLELLIEGLLGLDTLDLRGIGAIVSASVVPSLTAGLGTIAERRELALVLATAGHIPLPIRVERPDEVGADRLVNALAAVRLYGSPAIVIDLGTASTFDAIAPDGAFLGGAIAPGIEIGLDALATRTARLPRIELRSPDRAIARDTIGAIQAGSILGYQALATGLIGRIRQELADQAGVEPGSIQAILTGGLARLPWATGIAGISAIDPDLTLKGLA
ncbi:MAG: type III pantothenate kinase, partial [Candidatus Limnocylindrales bacterium]